MQDKIFLFWGFISFGLAILGIGFHVYRHKTRREERELEEVGREMAAKLDGQLVAVSALRLQIIVGVEWYYYGRWFWQKNHRVLLTICLTAAKNLRSVRTIAQQFANDYVAQPGCRNYLVRLAFKLLPETRKGEN